MNIVKLKKNTSPLTFVENTPVLPVVSKKDVKELLKLFEDQNMRNTFFSEYDEMDNPSDNK